MLGVGRACAVFMAATHPVIAGHDETVPIAGPSKNTYFSVLCKSPARGFRPVVSFLGVFGLQRYYTKKKTKKKTETCY